MSENNQEKQKKILITSALPYVNNIPHLGNIVGCVLSADVFARFNRLVSNETLFICGTDEHGTATETKALEDNVTPKEICDKYYKIHKKVYDWFNISFDKFGRTSDPVHHETTQDIFKDIQANGYIIEEEVEQLFCPKCDKFLADRFVEGTCPKCNFNDARGDQCDKCSKLLNPTELINPRCKICSSTPVLNKSNHLFIDLPKLKPELLEWMDKRSKEGKWSNNAITMSYAWIKEGLKKRPISRDLKWGIKIPFKGFEHKVFYVWFDAPIGYISITKNLLPDSWKDWWMDDENVKLYQFMGKDNIPFHTIIFPSSLIATKKPYTKLFTINSTEYLNYEDSKFSKSRKTGVFGTDAIDTGIDSDVYRYYLLSNRPEKADSKFLWDDFYEKNNNELVANLGNLVNRTMVFLTKYFDSTIPKFDNNTKDLEFLEEINKETDKVKEHLEKIELKDALKQVMKISKHANQYFQDNKPWQTIKEDKAKAGNSMFVLANICAKLSVLLEPFLPLTAKKLNMQLNLNQNNWSKIKTNLIPENHKLNKPILLFEKIEKEKIDELKIKFSGKQGETNMNTEEKKENNEFPLLLKVAKITDIKDHPDADKLYIIKVDLGDEQRQIVAGLKPFIPADKLLDKKIIIVANLEKAKLRGEESNGMLLAGDKDDIVKPLDPKEAELGEIITPKGMTPNTAKTTKINFKQFQKIKLTNKNKLVYFSDKRLISETGVEVKLDLDDDARIK
jgi:methionyl-tRNA synthetase